MLVLQKPRTSDSSARLFCWQTRFCLNKSGTTSCFSLNSLAVRVPHTISRRVFVIQTPDPLLRPVARLSGAGFTLKLMFFSISFGLFACKTNGFSISFGLVACKTNVVSTIPVARSIKQLCFFNDFGGPIYKTNVFLLLFWTLIIKPMLF